MLRCCDLVDHLILCSTTCLNPPNAIMLAQPCLFGIMAPDGTSASAIFPGCGRSVEFHQGGRATAHCPTSAKPPSPGPGGRNRCGPAQTQSARRYPHCGGKTVPGENPPTLKAGR